MNYYPVLKVFHSDLVADVVPPVAAVYCLREAVLRDGYGTCAGVWSEIHAPGCYVMGLPVYQSVERLYLDFLNGSGSNSLKVVWSWKVTGYYSWVTDSYDWVIYAYHGWERGDDLRVIGVYGWVRGDGWKVTGVCGWVKGVGLRVTAVYEEILDGRRAIGVCGWVKRGEWARGDG